MKQRLVLLALCLLCTLTSSRAEEVRHEWGVAVLELGETADARQEQLAIRKCLHLMGIPHLVTSSIENAVRHQLVLISGFLRNEINPAEREALYSYVERGGVLFATQVQANSFFPLFGLSAAEVSRTNFRVRFTDVDDPSLAYVNRPEERSVSLGNPALYTETIFSTEYRLGPRTLRLAQYENGAAAFAVHPYGRGLAYAIGLGFKETTMIPQLARSFESARQWINSFEPSGDVFRLVLRGVYEGNVHPFLLVHTIPAGHRTALVLSHDVDARESFRNALDFAQMEAQLGVKSTFFITTKYFSDSSDIGYYTPPRIRWLQDVLELGHEIGSHSVSHSLRFEQFPVGEPGVEFKTYDPQSPSVLGEVIVSKELLERDLGLGVEGFRAGYLRYPSKLLQLLEESGYAYDSSVSAQYVLTNFPYFGYRERLMGAKESNVVVVPVTLDDSRDFLVQSSKENVLRVWRNIIEANAENNAVTCLLIHPTNATYKLEVEKLLIEEYQNRDIWIGSVGKLARFWHDRSTIRPRLRKSRTGVFVISLDLNQPDVPRDQTLVVEKVPGIEAVKIVDKQGREISVKLRPAGERIFIHLR